MIWLSLALSLGSISLAFYALFLCVESEKRLKRDGGYIRLPDPKTFAEILERARNQP